MDDQRNSMRLDSQTLEMFGDGSVVHFRRAKSENRANCKEHSVMLKDF